MVKETVQIQQYVFCVIFRVGWTQSYTKTTRNTTFLLFVLARGHSSTLNFRKLEDSIRAVLVFLRGMGSGRSLAKSFPPCPWRSSPIWNLMIPWHTQPVIQFVGCWSTFVGDIFQSLRLGEIWWGESKFFHVWVQPSFQWGIKRVQTEAAFVSVQMQM